MYQAEWFFPVQTGSQVVYSKYAGTEVEFNGSKHLILKDDDIVGILETDDVKDLKPLNDRVLIKVCYLGIRVKCCLLIRVYHHSYYRSLTFMIFLRDGFTLYCYAYVFNWFLCHSILSGNLLLVLTIGFLMFASAIGYVFFHNFVSSFLFLCTTIKSGCNDLKNVGRLLRLRKRRPVACC